MSLVLYNSQKMHGFVLIYVAGMLVFLTSLVMLGVKEARIQANISAVLQEQLASRVRVSTAMALAKARIELAAPPSPPTHPFQTILAAVDMITVDGIPAIVEVSDADLEPDVNLLTDDDWIRLFRAYGLAESDAAAIAKHIIWRRNAAHGFKTITDLVLDPLLPTSMITGTTSVPAIEKILGAGNESKRLHVMDSPLALFTALLNASQSQLEQLENARKTRTLSVADAELLFGPKVRDLVYDGMPKRVLLRLSFPATPLTVNAVITVQKDGRLLAGAPVIAQAKMYRSQLSRPERVIDRLSQ